MLLYVAVEDTTALGRSFAAHHTEQVIPPQHGLAGAAVQTLVSMLVIPGRRVVPLAGR
jgi:hypothetical protein